MTPRLRCSTAIAVAALVRQGLTEREARAGLPRCICTECVPRGVPGLSRDSIRDLAASILANNRLPLVDGILLPSGSRVEFRDKQAVVSVSFDGGRTYDEVVGLPVDEEVAAKMSTALDEFDGNE